MANVYVDSNAAGAGTGADWANAYTTIGAALAAAGTVAGDNLWVAQDHAESSASAISWTDIKGTDAAPVKIICVNKAGSVPPVAADLRATGTVTTTGNSAITLNTTANRFGYIYGITFSCGSGAVSASLTSTSASANIVFDNCALKLAGTSGGSIVLGSAAGQTRNVLINTNMQFASTAANAQLNGTIVDWRGGTLQGATIPSTLFAPSTGVLARLTGLDLSAAGAGKTLVSNDGGLGQVYLIDCKLGASVTFATRATVLRRGASCLIRCDSGATAYRTESNFYEGDQQTTASVVRTGGASDGVTTIGWKLNTTANVTAPNPFNAVPISGFNSTTGSNITVAIEGVGDPRAFSALPKDNEIWFDLEYLGTASFPLGVYKLGNGNILQTGSAHSASTQAWDSAATARANSTAYTAGDVVKVATNAGRIFICTTSGTTAGSEPGGYATAVDGDSITDNTAVFKAGWRFKMSITTTAAPTFAAALQAIVHMIKASATVYIDPKLTLS